MADEGAQLEIQQQINKVLQERQAILAASAKQLQDQINIAMQLCDAMKCAGEGTSGGAANLEGMTSALEEAADAAEKPKSSLEAVADSAGGLGDKLNSAKVAALGAGVGLVSGFKGAMGMMAGVGKGIVGIVGSLGKVGATILKTPFKMMSGLIGMAQSGGGGPSPIRTELEAIRGEFGDIASNEGKAVAASLQQVQSQSQDLGGTGLKLSQVYGPGPEGVAAAMKDVHELATAMGPALSGLTDVIAKSGVELSMYRKGLGMTADQQAMMLQQASMAGKDPVAEMNKFASMAINMGEQFGVNAKVVGKSMAAMSADVANFGQLSVKELGKAAIYASKLGIEAKELQGVISKFDNFEDAAKGAGEMAQAFGMNVDAMELMNAQNPAERLSMLQKSFKETGKSVEDMSRQELKMLASQSGLSEEAAKLAFSQKGMSMNYDDISKAGDKSEKKQLSQAEAMDKLAGSIQKMTKGGGGGGFKGFFDAFLQGFGDGIKKSKVFRQLMQNIRKSLKVVFKAGKDVGKMFVKMFPGMKQFLTGLKDIFDPKKFKGLMNDVKKVFKKFFGDLNKDPVKATESFIKNIKKAFGKFFGKQGGAAKNVAEGGSKILKAVKGIFIGLLSVALKGLTNLIKKITDGIKNPKPIKSGLGAMFSSLFKEVGALLGALVPPLLKALGNLAKTLFIKFKPQLIKIGKVLLIAALSKMFLVAVLSALKGAVMGKLAGMLAKGFGKMFGGVAKSGPAVKAAKDSGKSMSKAGGIGKGLAGFIKGMGAVKIGDIFKAAIKMSILALTFIPVMQIFAYAAKEAYEVIKTTGPAKVAAGMIALAIAVGAAVVMAKAGQQINAGGSIKAMIGLAAGAIMLSVGGVAFAIALKTVAPEFLGVPWKMIPGAMLGMAIAAGASVVLAKAGSKISGGGAGKAIVGLLAGALMLLGGGLAFALALQIVSSAMDAIDGPKAAMGMFMLAAAAGGAVLLAMAAAPMQPPVLGTALLGLLAGAAMLTVGALAFSLALMVVTAVMPKDIKPTAQGFAMLVIAAGGAVLMAMAATAMIPTMATGMTGMLLGALFLGVVSGWFADALIYFGKSVAPKINLKSGVAMLTMAAVLAMMIPAAMAATVLGPFAILGLIGLPFAAAFLDSVNTLLMPKMVTFAAQKIDGKKVQALSLGLIYAMGALATVALASLALAIFSFPPIMWILESGMGVVVTFMGLMTTQLGPALAGFAKIKAAPGMKDKVEMMTKAVDGVVKLGDVAIGMAMIDAAAVEGGAKSGTVLDAVTRFMTVLIKGMAGMISSMVTLAAGIPEDKIAAVEAVAGIIGAIGKLIGAVMPPVTDLAKTMLEGASSGGGFFSKKKVDTSKFETMMSSVGSLIDGIMRAMKTAIVGMVKTVLNMEVPQGPGVTEKVKLIGDAIDIVTKMMDPMVKILGMIDKQEKKKGFFAKIADSIKGTDPAKSMMGQLSTIMTSLVPMVTKSLPEIVKGVIAAADAAGGTPKQMAPKMKLVATAIDIMGKMTGMLFKTLELIKGSGKKPNLKALDTLFGPKDKPKESIVFKIADSAGTAIKAIMVKIGEATKDIDVAKAKPGMELVAMGIKMVGDFASTIINIMKMVIPKGGDVKTMEKALPAVMKIMSSITSQIAQDLPRVINPILKIAGKVKNPKRMKAGMDVVASAIGAVGDFAGAIKDVMSIIPNTKGQTNATKLKAVTDAVGSIAGVIQTTMPAVLEALMNSIVLVKSKNINEKDVKVLAMMMETVGTFATAMKDIMSIMPEPPKNAKGDADRTGKLMGYVTNIAGAAEKGMGKLITGLMGVLNNKDIGSVYQKRHSLKALGVMFKSLGQFAEAISTMKGLGGEGGMKGAEKLIVSMGDLFKKGGVGSAAIASLIEGTASLKTKKLREGAANMKIFGTSVTKSIVPAMTAFSEMDTITAEKVASIGDGVTAAAQWFNELYKGDIKGVVELAKVLAKPGNNTMTIKTETPQIKATFVVNINAEQFAEKLAATGKMVATDSK